MPRPRDAGKQERIRAAVVALSGRFGLAGITMPATAAEAGIAVGTIYGYYPDKQAMLVDTYWALKRASAAATFLGDDPALPTRQRLRGIWLRALDHRRRHYDESVFTEQCYGSALIDADAREASHRLYAPIFDAIRTGIDREDLAPGDPFMLAAIAFGPVVELVHLERAGSLSLSAKRLEWAWDRVWAGMARA